ncbi:MAG: HD domain-containing protein [Chloroflexota bacterium]|nr:HD domain-containing protein [Chloroflexota bacterium]
MSRPDYEAVRRYAFERLERELSPALTYHSLAHTRDDVMPAVDRFAALESLSADSLLLLRTAAWLHDLGYVVQMRDHERFSAAFAAEVLPSFHYSVSDVDIVIAAIMVTRLPQTPRTLSEQILADADLDVLGQPDFPHKNIALRTELATFDRTYTNTEWFAAQLQFAQDHSYFTRAAHELNDAQKARNIAWLSARLAAAHAEGNQSS